MAGWRARVGLAIALSVTATLGSAAGAATLTKAQFVSQADALCRASLVSMKAVFAQYPNIRTDPSEAAAFVKAYGRVVQTQINKTRALTPPASIAALVTQMLNDSETAIKAVEANPSLLGAPDSPFTEADKIARSTKHGLGLIDSPGAGECVKAIG